VAQTGDVAELERLFAADVVSTADGGGFIRVAQTPVIGRDRGRQLHRRRQLGFTGLLATVIQANGRAAVRLSLAGAVAALLTVEASPEGIDQIMWVMRPSKLTGVAASSSHGRL